MEIGTHDTKKIVLREASGTGGYRALPRKKATPNRTERYTIRFTLDETKEIADRAKAAGLSVADYLRKSAFGKRITPKVDLHLVNELRRIGGLLKLVHTESGGAYSEKTREMLDELQMFVGIIAKHYSRSGGE